MANYSSERVSKDAELMSKADSGDADAQYKFAQHLSFEDKDTPRKDISPDEVKRTMDYLHLAAVQGIVLVGQPRTEPKRRKALEKFKWSDKRSR